ncbi:hypothetical protein NLI96_g4021 [Meripilus lineatus]|uniref:Alpha/beta hydrolase fold-3 domain-containing protein n=1 Tax=Meripilus lineatus TaxID=2056292 RepID=A0AAD5V7V5_9APHY|nr:hypothetical protein NLI96_g4021 [Physisporinus lineatus]
MSQYTHYSEITPEIAEVIGKLPPYASNGDFKADRDAAHAMMQASLDAQKEFLPPDSAYLVKDHFLSVEGGEILLRSVTPTPQEGEQDTFPLLVWYHGGGWAVGDAIFDDYYLRGLSVELRVSILNVNYRLAPENPFPVGHNDCFSALKWAAENALLLKASLEKGFIVAGQSAGGNLAGSVALRAAEDPLFERMAVPEKYQSQLLSLEQNKDAPVVSKKAMELVRGWLCAPPDDPVFSILLHPAHAKAPPTYIQVCGLDPLRDEGILYAKVIEEAGVRVKFDVYKGLPHAGHTMFPQLKVSKKFESDFRAHLLSLCPGPKQ